VRCGGNTARSDVTAVSWYELGFEDQRSGIRRVGLGLGRIMPLELIELLLLCKRRIWMEAWHGR
jgi:hypothetical protein